MDPIQEQIIADFLLFDEWMDKYEYLIELGATLAPLDEANRNERHAISGCQSRVWLAAEQTPDGRVHFTADSDAIITKGIVSLLIRVMEGRTPREILDTDLYFIDRTGLAANLSPTRANGLAAMARQMKMYALAFETKAGGTENREKQ